MIYMEITSLPNFLLMLDGKDSRSSIAIVSNFYRHYHERGKSIDSTGFYDQAESICEMIKLKLPHYSPLEPQKALSKAQIDPILAEIHHNRGCICTETNQ